MGRFSGKRVLITGGTSGIGLAGAKRIAQEGGEVIVTGLSKVHLDEANHNLPFGSLILQNDASNPASVHELVDKIKQVGRLDGVWFNAGYAAIAPIQETNAEFFDYMMAANVRGPALQITQLSKLLSRGASIVLTSSTSAYESAPMVSIYAATKGAIISMARCWAAALAGVEVRVNVLIPGPINTNFRNFMTDDLKQEFERKVISQVPLGRIGSADEAAAVALFLLSDESSYVTGSQFTVDGGLTMR